MRRTMPKDTRSVHMPDGTSEALEGLVTGDQTVNKLMVELILEGIERRRVSSQLVGIIDELELERLRAAAERLDKLKLEMEELRRENHQYADALLKAGEEHGEVKKGLDAAKKRTLELERELATTRSDREAAEKLLEELNMPKLTTELSNTNAALEMAKGSITELTGKLAAALREHDEAKADAGGQATAAYTKLLGQAHVLRRHLEHAVILPDSLFDTLDDFSKRAGGMDWRRRGCMFLVDGMEARRLSVPSGWMSDIVTRLPTLPELPTK